MVTSQNPDKYPGLLMLESQQFRFKTQIMLLQLCDLEQGL